MFGEPVNNLEKSVSRLKQSGDMNICTFAYLMAELYKYSRRSSRDLKQLHQSLASFGQFIGHRMVDLCFTRDGIHSYKRPVEIKAALNFIKTVAWRNIYKKELEELSQAVDNPK
ncbi:Threonylcarbamoyladenosine tRNA methylthiotransferase, partial [Cichlidogyrus casuarinus]